MNNIELQNIQYYTEKLTGFQKQNMQNFRTFRRLVLEKIKREDKEQFDKIVILADLMKRGKNDVKYALDNKMLFQDSVRYIPTMFYEMAQDYELVFDVNTNKHYINTDTDIYYLVSKGKSKSEVSREERERKAVYISTIPDNFLNKFVEKAQYWIAITQQRVEDCTEKLQENINRLRNYSMSVASGVELIMPSESESCTVSELAG